MFLDSLYSKYCILIKKYFDIVLNSSDRNSPPSPRGPTPPNESFAAGAPQEENNRNNRNRNDESSNSRSDKNYRYNEIGLTGTAEGECKDTKRPIPNGTVPISWDKFKLDDLKPSTSWREHEGYSDPYKIKDVKNIKKLKATLSKSKDKLLRKYDYYSWDSSNEKIIRMREEKTNVINYINLLKDELTDSNFEETFL